MKNFEENIYDDTEQKVEIGKSFVELLSEKNIKLNADADNLDEVIEITGQTMIDSGLVKKEYTEELKNQIMQYGKYILMLLMKNLFPLHFLKAVHEVKLFYHQ